MHSLSRLLISTTCCIWLASSLQAQLVSVVELPEDPRLTLPVVVEREAGSNAVLKADTTAKVHWTVLQPADFNKAVVLDDQRLLVTVPAKQTVWVLADLGERSQLLLIRAAKTPNPPDPPGPDPPSPDPPGPTPPPIPVPPLPNDYGLGVESFKLASPLGKDTASKLAAKFSAAEQTLYQSQSDIVSVWKDVWTANDAAFGSDVKYQAWRKFVWDKCKSLNEAKTILSVDTWRAAFKELQASLEAVK